jgi:hypothetical protein
MSAKFQLAVWRHAKQALAAGDSDSLEQLGFTPDMVDVLQRSSDAQLQVLAEQSPTLFKLHFDMEAAKLATTWRHAHPGASQAELNAFLDGVQAAKQLEPAG